MHFLFGTGLGMLILWVGIAFVVEKFRMKELRKKGISKEQWYQYH